MNKFFKILLILFFVSMCSNQNSGSVATIDKEEINSLRLTSLNTMYNIQENKKKMVTNYIINKYGCKIYYFTNTISFRKHNHGLSLNITFLDRIPIDITNRIEFWILNHLNETIK